MISERALSHEDKKSKPTGDLKDRHQDNFKKQRRDQLDLMMELLEATKLPVRKTRLLYQTATNYEQVTRYLDLLLKLGMVERISQPHDGFLITDKGTTLLRLFQIPADV